eukprot:Rhum_TRINITY_DN13612_c0_g1::Rhum_TRINITY_DN13612_c0_g1_i1::g.62612::m.62612
MGSVRGEGGGGNEGDHHAGSAQRIPCYLGGCHRSSRAVATLPLQLLVVQPRAVAVAVAAHVLPLHGVLRTLVHHRQKLAQLAPPRVLAVLLAEADHLVHALLARLSRQVHKRLPVVVRLAQAVAARLLRERLRRLLRLERTVLVRHDPPVVDHTAVVRHREQRRVRLHLLPVKVGVVVHQHTRVRERVRAERRPLRLRLRERLVHLLRAGGTRHDVQRRLRVDVRAVGLRLEHRVRALVVVLVAVHEQVHAVVEQRLLERVAQDLRVAVAVAVARAVHAAVSLQDDPRRHVTVLVRSREVLLQPRHERRRVRAAATHAEPQLRRERDIVHAAVVPREEQRVRRLAVRRLERRRHGVRRHAAEALDVVGEVGGAVLVVAVRHHVHVLRRNLLDVLEELVAPLAVLRRQVVAEVADVQEHVRHLRLRHQADRGVLLARLRRAHLRRVRARVAQRERAARAHVAQDDVPVRLVRSALAPVRDRVRGGVATRRRPGLVLHRRVRRQARHHRHVRVPRAAAVDRERAAVGRRRLTVAVLHLLPRAVALRHPAHRQGVRRLAECRVDLLDAAAGNGLHRRKCDDVRHLWKVFFFGSMKYRYCSFY